MIDKNKKEETKIRVDLHNHTSLCNHANGTMEEYVKKAIEEKIDVFGFSEHAPMNFDPKYRMDISQKSFYENEVKNLKEKYTNDIEILLAYEVDFMQNSTLMLDEILNATNYYDPFPYEYGPINLFNDCRTTTGDKATVNSATFCEKTGRLLISLVDMTGSTASRLNAYYVFQNDLWIDGGAV